MEELLVAIWRTSGGILLCKAHREENRPEMLVAHADSHVALDCTDTDDLKSIISRPLNKPDGCFYGCNNQAYIINPDMWDQLIISNAERKKAKKLAEKAEEIAEIEDYIRRCESNKLYTAQEAERKRKAYIAINNEGGEGYVPHYYTIESYNWALAKLQELKEIK